MTTRFAVTATVPAEPLVGISAGSFELAVVAVAVVAVVVAVVAIVVAVGAVAVAVGAVAAGFPCCAPAAGPAMQNTAANPALHRPNFILL